jgi:Tfp pilus assembly protein PilO
MDQLPKNTPKRNDLTGMSFHRYAHTFDPLLSKPKNRAYTTTILSFLVISLFLWYAIRPTLQTILSLRREIRDSLQVNQQMEEKISNLVEAQAKYQTASPRLPLMAQALPKNPDTVTLLLSLRNIASQSNASLSGIEISTVPIDSTSATGSGTQIPDNVYTNPITITVDGKYENLKQFLDTIFNMRRIVTIDNYSVDPIVSDVQNGTSDMLKLTLTMNIHYYPGAPYEH